MKQAIISTSIRFQSVEDVRAYQELGYCEIPEDDVEYNEVADYAVTRSSITLWGINGRMLATFPLDTVKGFAIDGIPVVIHGKEAV